MPVKFYSPEQSNSECYIVEPWEELLNFTVQLESSRVNLCLSGQPRDFVFISDEDNEVDIVLKKYNWVAKLVRGSSDFWIVYGYFSNSNTNVDEVVFLDEDALVVGPKNQISAAVYRIARCSVPAFDGSDLW